MDSCALGLEIDLVDPLTQRTMDDSSDSDLMLAAEAREVNGLTQRQDSPFLAISRLLWADRLRVAKATVAGLVIAASIALDSQ